MRISDTRLGGAAAGLLVLSIWLPACSENKTASEQAVHGRVSVPSETKRDLTVYAVNYPLSYFAERLAAELTEVRFPVPADVDPAFWKPSPEQIAGFQEADLIMLNGADYARWASYATLRKSRSVVTTRGCRETFIQIEDAAQHRHGPDGEHAHEGLAFTTWLDLGLALCQAERARDALISRLPASTETVSKAFDALRADLQPLDARLHRAAKQWGSTALLASHPVYPYFAEAYGLRIESLHLEPEEPLTADQLRRIEAWAAAQSDRPKLMLWEAEPLPATRKALQARNIEVVVFEPMGGRPARGDFLSGMTANVDRLTCAMGVETCR